MNLNSHQRTAQRMCYKNSKNESWGMSTSELSKHLDFWNRVKKLPKNTLPIKKVHKYLVIAISNCIINSQTEGHHRTYQLMEVPQNFFMLSCRVVYKLALQSHTYVQEDSFRCKKTNFCLHAYFAGYNFVYALPNEEHNRKFFSSWTQAVKQAWHEKERLSPAPDRLTPQTLHTYPSCHIYQQYKRAHRMLKQKIPFEL